MGKRVAIVQSNYIPWKGYFDLIRRVDEFILFDDMQYTRRDWRNRNQIKTAHGLQWLTIPVEVKGKYHQRIRDTRISDPTWNNTHWASIVHSYSRAKAFAWCRPWLEELYLGCRETYLSEVNYRFLSRISEVLGITTPLRWSNEFRLAEGKTERLVDLCVQAGATEYISGPAARDYIDPALFERAGVRLRWIHYGDYPEYPQLHGPFAPHVSIIDLLCNCGPESPRYLERPEHEALDRHDDVSVRAVPA